MHNKAVSAIRYYIKSSGKTQAMVAEEMGMSAKCLNQLLMQPDKMPKYNEAVKMVKALPILDSWDCIYGPIPKRG